VDVTRVETAIGVVESDPRAMEAVQAIVEMYGEGLARIVEQVDARALLDDELVEHLLLVHDLHPIPVEERVRAALAAACDDAELMSIRDGVAHVRLPAGGGGCAPLRLSRAIEEAVVNAAPEVEEVVIGDGVPLPVIQVVGGEQVA
jgi:Fe-S cluster biogenesis protein NfuA